MVVSSGSYLINVSLICRWLATSSTRLRQAGASWAWRGCGPIQFTLIW